VLCAARKSGAYTAGGRSASEANSAAASSTATNPRFGLGQPPADGDGFLGRGQRLLPPPHLREEGPEISHRGGQGFESPQLHPTHHSK
jgi:hypothetical protein